MTQLEDEDEFSSSSGSSSSSWVWFSLLGRSGKAFGTRESERLLIYS